MAAMTPEAVMLDLAYSFAKGKVLYTAVVTRIPDAFAEKGKPLTPREVAQLAKTDPNGTARILRTLSALDILEETEEGTYSLTPLGHLLRSDKEGNHSPQAALIINKNEPFYWNIWQELPKVLKEGGNGWDKCAESREHPTMRDYYQAHPESQFATDHAMIGISAAECPAILESYDSFEGMDMLMDVGGGLGGLLAAIVARFPSIKAVNFDLPHVIEKAPAIPGVEHVGGDFFKPESLPKAANIIMKHILQEYGNTACKAILQSCYHALPSGGRLLVVDFAVPNQGTAPREARQLMTLLDMETMLISGGQERSEAAWWDLLGVSGFEITRIVQTAVGPAIIEAIRM